MEVDLRVFQRYFAALDATRKSADVPNMMELSESEQLARTAAGEDNNPLPPPGNCTHPDKHAVYTYIHLEERAERCCMCDLQQQLESNTHQRQALTDYAERFKAIDSSVRTLMQACGLQPTALEPTEDPHAAVLADNATAACISDEIIQTLRWEDQSLAEFDRNTPQFEWARLIRGGVSQLVVQRLREMRGNPPS